MSEVETSGAQPETPGAETDNQTKKISQADLERALKDMHKFKSKTKELEAMLAQKDEEIQKVSQATLESQNNFKAAYENQKTLTESLKQKLAEAESEKNKFWDTYYQNEKKNEVFKHALKAGLRKEAETDLDLLQYEEVAIERTDQGRVLVHNADSFVEKLKATKPHWFQTKQVANINSGGTNKSSIGDGEITTATMVELQRKDPAKFREFWPKYAESQKKKQK